MGTEVHPHSDKVCFYSVGIRGAAVNSGRWMCASAVKH